MELSTLCIAGSNPDTRADRATVPEPAAAVYPGRLRWAGVSMERLILDVTDSKNTEIREPDGRAVIPGPSPIYAQVSALDRRVHRFERWFGWILNLLERWFPE